MENWQKVLVIIYGIVNLVVFSKGYRETKHKKNAFGLTLLLGPLGIFAWGDAVVFGLFWVIVTVLSLLLNEWNLFCLIVSVFWVVRSLGETLYWFNQQFSTINRNPPKNLFFYSIFQNDSVWFAYQIMWQCVTVASIIFSIYFSHTWLASRF